MSGTKDIRGVDVHPRKREPMPLPRREVAGGKTEVIAESTRHDGSVRHGVNQDNVNRGPRPGYNDPASEKYRRDLGNTPYPDKR
jgi:hypothetical protein